MTLKYVGVLLVFGLMTSLAPVAASASGVHEAIWQALSTWPGQVVQAAGQVDIAVSATHRVRGELMDSGESAWPTLYLLGAGYTALAPPPDAACGLYVPLAPLSAAAHSPTDLQRHPLFLAILEGCRALQTLRGLQGPLGPPPGLIGAGEGAAVALAVAAIMPDDVAFVCLHEPATPAVIAAAKAIPALDPRQFAAVVSAPVLLTLSASARSAQRTGCLQVAAALPRRPQLVEVPRSRNEARVCAQWSEWLTERPWAAAVSFTSP